MGCVAEFLPEYSASTPAWAANSITWNIKEDKNWGLQPIVKSQQEKLKAWKWKKQQHGFLITFRGQSIAKNLGKKSKIKETYIARLT